jgi:hypothetical protein
LVFHPALLNSLYNITLLKIQNMKIQNNILSQLCAETAIATLIALTARCNRHMKHLSLRISLLVLFALGFNANADQLVYFGFGTSASGNQSSVPYDAVGSYVTATPINTNGTVFGNMTLTYKTSSTTFVNQTGGQGPAPTLPWLNAQIPNGTYSTGGSSSTYFQFSITADSALTITNLQFDMARGSTTSSTRGVDVLLSIDGNTPQLLESLTDPDGLTGAADVFYFYGDSLDTTLNAADTADFIFEPWSTSGGGVRFDNIEVDGLPVPEPSSMVLAGLGGLSALLLKRRRA